MGEQLHKLWISYTYAGDPLILTFFCPFFCHCARGERLHRFHYKLQRENYCIGIFW